MNLLRLSIIFFLGMAQVSNAEIYQWTDSQGRNHYSDQKKAQAKLLRISPGYSYYHVRKVFDGDTILLENDTKVRLLGINAPEVEGRNKSAEAGGIEAKRWLEKTLSGSKVRLEKGAETKDKYGRLLAHVFTENKNHLNLELIRRGLAAISIYPPNLKYSEVLLQAQYQAESENLGIWGNENYHPKAILSLEQKKLKGWQRLFGRVISIRESRKYVYLEFSSYFDARIAKKNLIHFDDITEYLNKNIELRGWLSKRKNHQSMLIRHPSAIKVSSKLFK